MEEERKVAASSNGSGEDHKTQIDTLNELNIVENPSDANAISSYGEKEDSNRERLAAIMSAGHYSSASFSVPQVSRSFKVDRINPRKSLNANG